MCVNCVCVLQVVHEEAFVGDGVVDVVGSEEEGEAEVRPAGTPG